MFFGKVARDSREPLAGNRRVSPEDAPSLTSERIAFVLVLLATAIVAIIRWGLLSMPLERDEGEYAYAGQLVLQGIPPYKLAYNMKLPGTYVVYAAIMAVFGQTPSAIHIGLLLSSLISMALVFFIARRMFDPLAAAASSAVYGFLALSPSVLGLAGHATQFMVPFVLGGVLLLQKWELAGTAKHLGWSALLFGMAFLMKQQAVFFVAFGLVFVLRTAVKEHRRVAAAVSLYSVSALIPFALTCACLGALGVFGRFWFWCFSYARQYVSQIALRDGIGLLHLNGASVV
ncbi:MAG: glycosyltransferase family 39 protein, partial [Armatimonadota bacterium]